jgi:predicted transcriptional regulator
LTNDSTHAMLTSYALVLLAIASDPRVRVSDIAGTLGISQRRVYNVIGELLEQSLLSVSRERHQKVYAINRDAELSVPILGRMTLGELLYVLAPPHR